MAAATAAFLSRAGLRSGWSCLDVGCGGGQVTIELARAVGPRGRVVGLDVDAAALDTARRAAERAGVVAEFVRADATSPWASDAFDLAYSRLVLSHLVDAAAAVRAMTAAVRPGGVVAVEDLYTGTLRAEPPGRRAGPAAGPLLRHGARARGRPRPSGRACRRCWPPPGSRTSGRRSREPDAHGGGQALPGGAAGQHARRHARGRRRGTPELDEVRAEVDRAARDPGTVFHQARIHQVHGHRPRGS